jgi:hypothetical protein
MNRPNFEVDEVTFPAEAYRVKGSAGVAWRVYGWEIERVFPEYETECWACDGSGTRYNTDEPCKRCAGSGKVWTQEEEPEKVRTGRVVCVMVGDNARFTFDPDQLTPLDDLAYCTQCGQIGCGHDGRVRDDG